MAKLLDEAFTIPVINKKIGFDAIAGLIPGVGDVAPLICSLYIVWQAHIDGVNKWTLTRMLKNIFIDSLGGAIPFLGDIFDVLFKANTKNMALWKSNISTTPSSSIQYKDKFYIIAAISVVFAIGIGISILVIMLFLNLLKAIN